MLLPLLKELNNGIYVKYGNNISLFVRLRVFTTIKSEAFKFGFLLDHDGKKRVESNTCP